MNKKFDFKNATLPEKIEFFYGQLYKPTKAVVTAGMPYANGPLHLGHLAGAHVPADIYARWMRMLIGGDNVLFVCGTDDHGSNSEVSAQKAGMSTRDFIDGIHAKQSQTMKNYGISLDVYSGTSREEHGEDHLNLCQDMLRALYNNKRLEKKTSLQWFDPKADMFLPDRFVTGTCPKCEAPGAYSEECDTCGATYEASELIDPVSSVTQTKPELRETDHWFLDMWQSVDELKAWIDTKKKLWRKNVLTEVESTVKPSLVFSNTHEEEYKKIKEELPTHKSRYAPGKKVVLAFEKLADLNSAMERLSSLSFDCSLMDGWAHRSITRDVKWGLSVPSDIDEAMKDKTLYVWPESLIAPISFTRVALKNKGLDPETYKDYWHDDKARVYQFLGQDNIYFYVLMQGAMWLGSQKDPSRLPEKGDLQMTDIFSSYHLQVDGAKMSKSKGNSYTAAELIDPDGKMKYSPEQIRYFLATLSLADKNSNFDFETFASRNDFLAGPLNASFEKPIAAVHSKFGGIVPKGDLIGKTENETAKIIQNYFKMMEKGDFAKIIFMIENYARVINSLFAQFKPHDDRHDQKEREDALYSCFYVLKNVMIMLHPFAPQTMDKLCGVLGFDDSVFRLEELMVPFAAGTKIGEMTEFFPQKSDA